MEFNGPLLCRIYFSCFFFLFQTVKTVCAIKKKTTGIHENSKSARLQITPLFCHKGYSYCASAGLATTAASYNNTHLQVGSVAHIFISHPPKIVQSTYQIPLTSKDAKFNWKSFNESHTIVANLLLLKKHFFFFCCSEAKQTPEAGERTNAARRHPNTPG